MSHAPNRCPKCGGPTRIRQSVDRDWVIVHTRECLRIACNHRYVTFEKFAPANMVEKEHDYLLD